MFVQTLTLGPVVDDQTVGVGSTLGSVARVDTLPVPAPVPGTGQVVPAVPVGPALVGILAAGGVRISHQTSGTGTLEGSWSVSTLGSRVADLVLALVDVGTARGSWYEAEATDTAAVLTDLPRPAVLLLVTARLAGAVNTDLSLEAVLVTVADLGTQSSQTSLSLGTVHIDPALQVAQASLALVISQTFSSRTLGRDPHTALLGRGNSSEPLWAGAVHLLVDDLTESVGSTGPLLLAGVDTLEVDADLV